MLMRNKHLVILCLVLIIGLGVLAGRGCPKRRSDRKVGSSGIPEWSLPAPSNLTATAVSFSQIALSWIGSLGADGYEIERSVMTNTAYSPLATVGPNITFYSDPGPFSLTTYYYRIRAFNTIGDRSAYSNVASASTAPLEWQSIAVGESHSLALATNGMLWGWGDNQYGQLDPSNYTSSFTFPTLLNLDTDWLAIVAGYYHTLAIKTDSTLWAWGDNTLGQLGLGNTDYPDSPTRVGLNSDWSIAVGGEYHTIALKTGGTLWAWGYNTNGQLGLGDAGNRSTPSSVGTQSDWSLIDAGYLHSLGLKTNGTLWAWGWNWYGQLGDGTNTTRTIPRSIGMDADWSIVSAGYVQTIALKITGTLWWWGSTQSETFYIPRQIGTDTDWAMITAGGTDFTSYFSLALKTNGTLWAWGQNSSGQLGLGDNAERTNPIQLRPYEYRDDWSEVVAGGFHALARTNDGDIWVWGRNDSGQLGIGNTVNQIIPINLNFPQPGNLIATVISYTRIALSWTDNSDRETGFIIERSLNGMNYELLTTTNANVTSYPDETVIQGNYYYYRVKAIYSEIDSLYSNIAVGVTRFWSERTPSGSPSARAYHPMVWDGQRVIMFSGYDGTYKNDLWWYNPGLNTWRQVTPTGSSPTARYCHSMVWDSVGQRVIMFGGYDSSYNYKNDLWWYDPASGTTGAWIQMKAQGEAGSPPSRESPSMVWDGQKVIMFGGFLGSYKNDLWWYDPASGTTGAWIQMKAQGAPGSPSARKRHSMVWDPIGNRVIMFGGENALGSKNDLWWYEPISNTWTQKKTGVADGSPPSRYFHSMVWDSVGQRMIMFGGRDASYTNKNDLWWYDPETNTWQVQIAQDADGSPTARYSQSMVWDPIGQRVIMFGGNDGTNNKNDLWWWW